MLQYLTAFGAGVMTFLSPCVLPLLPGYFSMLSGFSAAEILDGDERAAVRKVVLNALAFAAGFSLVFTLMGAAATGIGGLLADHKRALLKVFGMMMVVLGIHMTGLISIGPLNYEKRFSMRSLGGGYAGSFLMGCAFSLGWSPCIGPILAGILSMAAVSGQAWKGGTLLLAYSAGLAAPLLLAAFLTVEFFSFVGRFRKALRWVETAAGALMIAMGVLLYFDRLMFID
ncbi:MAG TPA: cytochrome c biogenesis protein CcdA [Elusimicrobiales bacterium]|nr:cytochrome c biogenesis protein CcdA [Elusimicrobiales bacterium]